MRRALILLAALTCALVAAGCGDDDSSSSTLLTPTSGTPQASLSKDDLISEGDEICAEVNAAIGAAENSTDTSSVVSQSADLYEGMVDQLRSLGKPSEDSGLDAFFNAGDDLVDAERNAELAAQRGDDAGLSEAQSDASSALESFRVAAEDYGFSECGQAPEAPSVSGGATPTTSVPVTPVPAPTPAPAPAPTTPPPPTGGAGQGGTGGGSGGTGGIGPG